MLRVAVQSKGRLFEDTMNLLAEADIKVGSSKRTLLVESTNSRSKCFICEMMTFRSVWQAVSPTSVLWARMSFLNVRKMQR